MRLRFYLLGALLTASATTFAGDKSHGGDAIVCRDGVYLLDYVEMRQRQMPLKLQGRTIREKVENIVEKLRTLDPARYAILKTTAEWLVADIEARPPGAANASFKHTKFTADVLSDIPDSLEILIPEGCKKEQLVVQAEPVFPTDRLFTIYSPLWDRMDQNQQVMTVLHEAWYRIFLTGDSRYTRYMNAFFASLGEQQLSSAEYFDLLKFSGKLGSWANYEYDLLAQHFTFLMKEMVPSPYKTWPGLTLFPCISVSCRIHSTASSSANVTQVETGAFDVLGMALSSQGKNLFSAIFVGGAPWRSQDTYAFKGVRFKFFNQNYSQVRGLATLFEEGKIVGLNGCVDWVEFQGKRETNVSIDITVDGEEVVLVTKNCK